MSEILTAVFQNGAFVPEQATRFAPGARVRMVVESLGEKPALTIDEFDALADELSINSGGLRLTRDQLHDRG
jgi:predicted DNA-binding antitoxin AbrB/MazE fold protein